MKKNFFYIFFILIIFSLFSFSAFAKFNPGEWSEVEGYEQRKVYLVDKGEISNRAMELYRYITSRDVEINNNPFWDVNENDGNILKAYSLNLVSGVSGSEFGSGNTVNRAEFAVLIWNLCNALNENANFSDHGNIWFTDAVPDYAYASMQYGFSRGFIQSRYNNFERIGAYDPISLEECMETLDRVMRSYPNFNLHYNTFNYKKAYLTFDDNTSKNTEEILNTLKYYGAKGTFFVTGYGDENLIRRMRDEGHAVGNHTFSHSYAGIYSGSAAFWNDFNKEQRYLSSVLGYQPFLMRFPGGSTNTVSYRYGGTGIMRTLAAQSESRGYIYCDWNVSANDSAGGNISKSAIIRNVVSGAGNKKEIIILMHMNIGKDNTAAALPEIIEKLRNQGYIFPKITEDSVKMQYLK